MKTAYDVLGISRDATGIEIRRAFEKLAKQEHPDLSGQNSAQRFQRIKEAYDILRNENKRRSYDAKIYKQQGYYRDVAEEDLANVRARAEEFRRRYVNKHRM